MLDSAVTLTVSTVARTYIEVHPDVSKDSTSTKRSKTERRREHPTGNSALAIDHSRLASGDIRHYIRLEEDQELTIAGETVMTRPSISLTLVGPRDATTTAFVKARLLAIMDWLEANTTVEKIMFGES